MADEKNVQVENSEVVESEEEVKDTNLPTLLKIVGFVGASIAALGLVGFAIYKGHVYYVETAKEAEEAKKIITEVYNEGLKAIAQK